MERQARFVADAGGSAVVEFALLVPIFLLLLTGILAYGLYFGAAHAVQQLAADAARLSIAGIDMEERGRLVEQFLTSEAGSYMLVDGASLTHEVGPVPGAADRYRVIVRYAADALPIWNLYPPLPLPSREIVFSSTIVLGRS